MARDAGSGVDTLVVSGDSRLLAFVGPSKYIVTVMEACSLDEVPSGLPSLLGTGMALGIPQAAPRQVGHQLALSSLRSLL